MKLVFIGSGSAFTVGDNNYNSNMLLMDEKHEKKLLIDCGSDARHALNDLKLSYRDITDVYISHMHADHAGGLEWLALSRKFDPQCEKPNLYANQVIIEDLWNHSLSGGLTTLQNTKNELDCFFIIHRIPYNGSFIWDNIHFQTIQTVHAVAGYALMPSYGLLFTIHKTRILITTDTQFAPHQLLDIYKSVDIIFQDCETAPIKSGVHAHFSELDSLAPEIKAKMWLYHYQPGEKPDAKKHGFCGFVARGQTFKF